MLRSSLLLILAFGSIYTARGQVKFGVQAGVGFSDVVAVNRSQTLGHTYTDDFYEIKPSITFGFSALFPLSERLELMSLLQYTNKGTRLISSPNDDGFLDLRYVSIPLMIRYNMKHRWFLEVGPEIAYLFNASIRKVSGDHAQYHSLIDLGINTGVGYYFTEKISLGLRYYIGLVDIYNEENIPNSPPSVNDSGYYNRYAQFFGSFKLSKK